MKFFEYNAWTLVNDFSDDFDAERLQLSDSRFTKFFSMLLIGF